MTVLRRLFDRAVAGPDLPPDAGDLAEVRLFGLAFPARATIAILAVTALIVVDLLGWSIGAELLARPAGLDEVAARRFLLFLVAPLLIVLVAFRDDPARYGLRLGDWRWGAGLLVVGLAVMTPIILALANVDAFRGYYGAAGASPEPLAREVADNVVELLPAEFLLRGFLMFALWRRIGPLALVVSLVPFVLTHLGKPEIELWSTFIGGSIFAWLDWRTGSILWSALGHVYVLTLMTVAVGGATVG